MHIDKIYSQLARMYVKKYSQEKLPLLLFYMHKTYIFHLLIFRKYLRIKPICPTTSCFELVARNKTILIRGLLMNYSLC